MTNFSVFISRISMKLCVISKNIALTAAGKYTISIVTHLLYSNVSLSTYLFITIFHSFLFRMSRTLRVTRNDFTLLTAGTYKISYSALNICFNDSISTYLFVLTFLSYYISRFTRQPGVSPLLRKRHMGRQDQLRRLHGQLEVQPGRL